MKWLFLTLLIMRLAHAGECIAHRGYAKDVIENSLNSVLSAVAYGADGIEFDIRHTKDGVPILLHDSKLKRVGDQTFTTCPLKTKVSKLSWNEINENCRLADGQHVSTLSEVLSNTANYRGYLFIELKDLPGQKFKEIIQSSGVKQEKIRFISFRLKYLQKAREFFPAIESMRLSGPVPFFAWTRGMNVYYPLRFFAGVSRLLDHETGVWTVNDREQLERLHTRSVDFITTDNLELCLETKS